MIDRSEVSRALAKAIAFKAVGNDAEANDWAARLVVMLECEDILTLRAADRGGANGREPGHYPERFADDR